MRSVNGPGLSPGRLGHGLSINDGSFLALGFPAEQNDFFIKALLEPGRGRVALGFFPPGGVLPASAKKAGRNRSALFA